MTWADSAYKYKKQITIDYTKVAGDEVNFPVLLSITDANLADTSNGGHVESSSGYDIVFYDSAEATLLYHEIEKYGNTNGLLVFWINVSSLSSTENTIIYMYYGKPGVTVDPSSTSTWDANYDLVYHLDDSLASADSTANARNGTWVQTPTMITNGQIDGAIDLNQGTNSDYVNFADFNNPDDNSLEIWVNWDLLVSARLNIPYLAYDVSNSYYALGIMASATTTNIRLFVLHTEFSGGAVNTGSWKHIVITYDYGTRAYAGYVNSVNVGSGTAAIACDSQHLYGPGYPNVNAIEGKCDEMRISHVVRSSTWVTTSYNSQNSPSTFLSLGGELKLLRSPRSTATVGLPEII